MNLTKEGILAGTVDVKEVGMKELKAFIEKNALKVQTNGKSKATVLNAICDALDIKAPEGSMPVPSTPPGETPVSDALDGAKPETEKAAEPPAKSKSAEPSNKKEPPFLARRKLQIEAAKKAMAASDGENPGIDPGAYEGEDVPEFLKRRMRREEG